MTIKEIGLNSIESKIFLIRGEKVMLDYDLAELYEVETRRLNEQVRRNHKRFPSDFMFVLTEQEVTILKSQFATSRFEWGGRRKPVSAFTEHGVAMLSSILKSERALEVNVSIIRAFVKLRQVLSSNAELEKKINELEKKHDAKFQIVFNAIRELMSSHTIPRKRIIGLSQKEEKDKK